MEENVCNDTRFKRISKYMAAEIVALLNGGQVDGTPTRRKPSIANMLVMLGMAGAIAMVGWAAAGEATSIKLTVFAVDKRQAEDRAEFNGKIKEVRDDVRQIRTDMQNILGAVERINGRREAERERRGR